ncbi:Sterol 3-beta-glucosyltransferase [Hondaea fermentalgiana]|uniref:Sterol 3-beta-glucosyltransferase n=1 Tax=Hondaea fermentalgiana TaxID=2315210 RepID=A0A2R5GG62_9STRA|nr:Sterol 3-beta-glucosyltransferase [Hondaea fermentalgiana]|eukprot:GBG28758.1 Sterol 3-beta-glucosyltransferase [Hondaea fermentalgiana]
MLLQQGQGSQSSLLQTGAQSSNAASNRSSQRRDRLSPRSMSQRVSSTEKKLLDQAIEAPAQIIASSKASPDPSDRLNLPIIVMALTNPPESSRGLRETHYIVKVYIGDTTRHASTNPMVRRMDHSITWGEVLVLEDVGSEALLDIRLLVRHRLIGNEEIGRTEISVGELVRRPFRNLVIHNSASRVVTDSNEDNVTLLKIGVDKSALPRSWPMPVNESYASRGYPKHVMIITRGTRGDVQPFLALARELANRFNWMVTICSEFRYKDYIKKQALGLERGCIRFRISGGDTQKRVDSRISKWAINLSSSTMQHIMLAFSEREFFDSEPALFYWAKTIKPDYLMFGFTLAAIAMIIRPADWGPKSILTNYIFLRGKTVPPLDPKHVDFIEQARNNGRKLVVLAFSSMPVERLDILRIAIKIISGCEKEVSIFALIGDHVGDPGNDSDVEGAAAGYAAKGRLLVDKGAPFGRLFPLMDAIVAHGGLGTTGEAIMAGVPVIITGVMLFDQRFWGSRCHDLGIGPFPVHVSKFKSQCVSLIDKALADDSEWPANAKRVGREIESTMEDDPAGVIINAKTVCRLLDDAPVFSYEAAPPGSTAKAMGTSARGINEESFQADDEVLDAFAKGNITEEEEEEEDEKVTASSEASSGGHSRHASRLRGLLGI